MDQLANPYAVSDPVAADGVLRPPLYWRLAYRLLFRRLPAEYGPWVAQDMTGGRWPLRITLTKYLNTLLVVGIATLVWKVAEGDWPRVGQFLLLFVVVLLPFEYIRSNRRPVSSRKEILDHQGIDKTGRPVARKAGRFDGLRRRLLPSRDIEAVGYIVLVMISLSATAAVGLHRREPAPTGPKITGSRPKSCTPVTSGMSAAILKTLPKGTTVVSSAAHKHKQGVSVAMLVKNPKNKAQSTAFGVFLLAAEGDGFRVSVASFPESQLKTVAPVQNVGTEGELHDAALNALNCMTHRK